MVEYSLNVLRNMEIGQVCTFSAEKMMTIRANISAYSVQWDRTYTTKVNRKQRTISVERIS